MNISWYYRRLKTMGLGEISWRIRRLLWQLTARLLHGRWERKYQNSYSDTKMVLDAVDTIKFYGLSDIKPDDMPQQWKTNTIAQAEDLLKHRIDCLALNHLEMGKEINWNREYKRGIDTPLLFGPWMDYRDTESYGDFKYFWEVPRLQHLITLAKAYFLTNEEKYAKEVINQIRGFIEQSPYLLGVNWIMPMEAGIRLVSISWVTFFLKEYLKNEGQACNLIYRLVRSHLDYITKNYAAYSSANNHLIGEAAGVFIASICFGGLKKARTYRDMAYQILCKEIVRQHHQDGVNKEQAVHYQIFAFNFLLLAGLLGKANGIDFPEYFWQIIEKNAAFISAIADDNCLLPDIGDSDDGKAILLSEKNYNPVKSVLAVSAVLFKRNDFKEKAKIFDEISFWLLGNKGKIEFDNLNKSQDFPPRRFENGGYYILSSNKNAKAKIIFDCGPLGFGPIAAHGHADSLSFVLYAYGKLFFADPGTYTYIAGNCYRNYFRSTQAHNTIVVDGENQSQIAGPFLWMKKANSFVDNFISNNCCDEVTGWHDGYLRLGSPVKHQRTIKLDKEKEVIMISDFLEMSDGHKIEQYFHLSPECDVKQLENNTWLITHTGHKITITIDNKLKCSIYKGSENPLCGWYSDAYDQKKPSNTFLSQGNFSGNQQFLTVINLTD